LPLPRIRRRNPRERRRIRASGRLLVRRPSRRALRDPPRRWSAVTFGATASDSCRDRPGRWEKQSVGSTGEAKVLVTDELASETSRLGSAASVPHIPPGGTSTDQGGPPAFLARSKKSTIGPGSSSPIVD